MIDHSASLIKLLLAPVATGGIWVFDIVATDIGNLPRWIQDLGVPVAFLIVTIYGLKSVHGLYREATNARIADQAAFSAALQAQLEKGHESREKLIAVQIETKDAIRDLSTEMKGRPCGMTFPRREL